MVRVLLLLLLLSLPLSAATRYVSTTGSDSSGDGSEANPWASINHATGQVDDGDLILVKPGTYTGRQRLLGQWAQGITIRSEIPYQAHLQNNDRVVTCYGGQNITFEGFELSHTGPGSGGLVMHVQSAARDITIRNNVFHDSYNNDLLKVNNGTERISILDNMFYNQQGSDEHIDVNSVNEVLVQDNVFFNDFPGSGRDITSTSSFIVVKDSNDDSDGVVGTRNVRIRRNIMLNYTGSTGANFILFGEDGQSFYEAFDCVAENNLLIGNSSATMRAAFGVKGCRDITFRNNTVVGNLPSLAFAMRLNREGQNLQLSGIRFYNNIWSDPTGTMEDFSDTPPADLIDFTLSNNLYWNAGANIPTQSGEAVNFTDDAERIVGDPVLGSQTDPITPPRWVPATNRFADGSETIRQVFENLARQYGTPGSNSAAIGVADPDQVPEDDLLGEFRPLGGPHDVGAIKAPLNYSQWSLINLEEGERAFTNDPDGDGFDNGLEYALDTNPNNAASSPQSRINNDELTIEFSRVMRPDIQFLPQASRDLQSWDEPVEILVNSSEQLIFRASNIGSMAFLRLRVELR